VAESHTAIRRLGPGTGAARALLLSNARLKTGTSHRRIKVRPGRALIASRIQTTAPATSVSPTLFFTGPQGIRGDTYRSRGIPLFPVAIGYGAMRRAASQGITSSWKKKPCGKDVPRNKPRANAGTDSSMTMKKALTHLRISANREQRTASHAKVADSYPQLLRKTTLDSGTTNQPRGQGPCESHFMQ